MTRTAAQQAAYDRIMGTAETVREQAAAGVIEDRYADAEAAPAPVEVVANFQVCLDCMLWVAGYDEHERGEAYPAAVVEAMTAPEAAAWHLVNACGDDEETGHEYTCTSFTYAPCDTCASWLGGERHAVAALSR